MKDKSSILAVGTVAIDAVETPLGKRDKCFGGSASYFSYAASFFTSVKIVAVVGDDFPAEYRAVLEQKGVDLSGIEVRKGEKTFFWRGKYKGAMNEAETLATELNALLAFKPLLALQDTQPVLFLANVDPEIQYKVIEQKKGSKFTVMDTMNFWIQNKLETLKKVLAKIDALVVNEGEARQLTGESNLIRAGEALRCMGPSHVIVKKGEHGVLLFGDEGFFALPAYPVKDVYDPTGAGDSFAGGMVGYIAKTGTYDFATLRQALIWGTVVASFTVEDFSLERLIRLKPDELQQRYNDFVKIIRL
ncbi:MAG: sugar kinase [Candidatus Omnitrophica bacterium]|nr:sugar kinase [Candidatus Omnitrophota bacterium]